MRFRTEVALPAQSLTLTPRSRLLFVGSCFAEHIGKHMAVCLPSSQVGINPCGVCYNPASLSQSIRSVFSPFPKDCRKLMFEDSDGWWHHWHYSTLFTAANADELEELLRERHEGYASLVRQLDTLVITFSTDHVYTLRSGACSGHVVNNCHKQPGDLFDERILPPDEVYKDWHRLLEELFAWQPDLRIIMTLSPYRYAKHGLHESALSKARLLTLIDRLSLDYPCAAYFPAYEIVTDELRDYRFYAADMLHPSDQAIDYVWERFKSWVFSPELDDYARDRCRLARDLAHRPLRTTGTTYERFIAGIEQRKKEFERKWKSPFAP